MSGEVWVSSVRGDSSFGSYQGAREKYFGQDWAPPSHKFGVDLDPIYQASTRHKRGEKLARTELTEAMYVFSPGHWRRVGDLFFAGRFFAVKGKLAELLERFDLGGGELIEFPIYAADKQTRLPGPFYLLNFGAQKNAFLPEQSREVKPFFTIERDGTEVWKARLSPDDGDIALAPAASEGPDLWFEPRLKDKIFMSGRLHDAIAAAKIKIDFRFSRARVVGMGDRGDGHGRGA